MKFDAEGVFLERGSDSVWKERPVRVHSISDIREIFKPYESDVTQVNISRSEKLYYSISFMADKCNTEAKIKDMNGNQNYLVSPILLIECDTNDIPTNISEVTKDRLLSLLERF